MLRVPPHLPEKHSSARSSVGSGGLFNFEQLVVSSRHRIGPRRHMRRKIGQLTVLPPHPWNPNAK